VPTLIARLDDPDRDVREWCARALGTLGDPSAAPKLLALRADPDLFVRHWASRAYVQLKGQVHE
jgi:HEAT repeat protein